jgi:hypothetical protein
MRAFFYEEWYHLTKKIKAVNLLLIKNEQWGYPINLQQK